MSPTEAMTQFKSVITDSDLAAEARLCVSLIDELLDGDAAAIDELLGGDADAKAFWVPKEDSEAVLLENF